MWLGSSGISVGFSQDVDIVRAFYVMRLVNNPALNLETGSRQLCVANGNEVLEKVTIRNDFVQQDMADNNTQPQPRRGLGRWQKNQKTLLLFR